MVSSQPCLFMHNGRHAPFASAFCVYGKQCPELVGRGPRAASLSRALGCGFRRDVIVPLCDAAQAGPCPQLSAPGAITTHWGFPDPPAAKDPEGCFERVRGGIEQCLRIFMAQADRPLAERAKAAAAVAERFCLAENWA